MLDDRESSKRPPTRLPRSIVSRLASLLLQPISMPFIAWPLGCMSVFSLLPRWVLAIVAPVLFLACGTAALSFQISDDSLRAAVCKIRVWEVPLQNIVSIRMGPVPLGSSGQTRGIVVVARQPSGSEREIALASTALMSRAALARWIALTEERLRERP